MLSELSTTDLDALRREYDAVREVALRFRDTLAEQTQGLLSASGISLGVPLECRVKSWDSIAGKIERASVKLQGIKQLNDLVGLRLILLFRRDVANVCELISRNFTVVSQEDTSQRLAETEFGYQSLHYIIKLPEDWLSVPTFREFDGFQAEIQVRTLAQHIWAAGSHFLQYKREVSVPPPVRRSIYRVSALLETVDLEFERVLDERESYISDISELRADKSRDEPLNVDLLGKILDERLPQENKMEGEPYSELLEELHHFHIDSPRRLTELIRKHLEDALAADAEQVHARNAPGGPKIRGASVADSRLTAIKARLWNQSKKFLSACLEHLAGWRLDDGEVVFLYAQKDSLYADLLKSREQEETLRAVSTQVLGRPVSIHVKVVDTEAASKVRWGHVGLVRYMMGIEFGDRWRSYRQSKQARKP